MKKLLTLIVVAVLAFHADAQNTTVDCSGTIKSTVLKQEMSYAVLLPPSYQSSNRHYPVLYLLHGAWDNYTAWVLKGNLQSIASKLMESGEIPEMIIVTPDGLTDAFYINNYDKSTRWEDFFHQEFIPQIEQKYRIIAQRKFRAIAGLSMGGYGSLYHGLKYKDKFSSVYAMSAAVLEVSNANQQNAEEAKNNEFYQKLWGPLNSEGYPTNYKAHSIQEMINQMESFKPPYQLMLQTSGLPNIMLDCGDDDFLLLQNLHLSELMKNKNIPFELRIRNGAHDWPYWREALPEALKFVAISFSN